VSSDRIFLFTITPGHSGTTWLTDLLAANLPDSTVYHEILGYDRFGVDTPDLSHMTLFNSQGNVAPVRAFWQRKAERILSGSGRWYAETSHLLAKCGLLENIDLFTRHGRVFIVCLDRDLLALVRSMRRRHDMVNKGNQWLWHLDPDYPRKLVADEFFQPHGIDGLRLWYGCEMRARAAYYRLLLGETPGLSFVQVSLESLGSEAGLMALFDFLEVEYQRPRTLSIPSPRNASGHTHDGADEPIARVIEGMHFDPVQIASSYIDSGYRLGVDLGGAGAPSTMESRCARSPV
jgi:hypothetical protein